MYARSGRQGGEVSNNPVRSETQSLAQPLIDELKQVVNLLDIQKKQIKAQNIPSILEISLRQKEAGEQIDCLAGLWQASFSAQPQSVRAVADQKKIESLNKEISAKSLENQRHLKDLAQNNQSRLKDIKKIIKNSNFTLPPASQFVNIKA